jgi:hypothetical protein
MIDINDLSEEKQLYFIKKDYKLIDYISNPSDYLKFEVVKLSALNIFSIVPRSEELEIEAVKHIKRFDIDSDIIFMNLLYHKKAKEFYLKLRKVVGIIK